MSKLDSGRWSEPGRRWDEADARAALEALASSGLGVDAFARKHGFTAQRLRDWCDRLRLPLPRSWTGTRRGGSTALVPVVVKPAPVTLRVDDGVAVVIRVGSAVIELRRPAAVDPAWLARFVAEVGGAG